MNNSATLSVSEPGSMYQDHHDYQEKLGLLPQGGGNEKYECSVGGPQRHLLIHPHPVIEVNRKLQEANYIKIEWPLLFMSEGLSHHTRHKTTT